MVSKLTHVKSPLVLVCSKDVDKLLGGLNISWMTVHGANGISAHRSLRDETVVRYISLAKLLFTSHKSFPFSKKGKRNKSLSIAWSLYQVFWWNPTWNWSRINFCVYRTQVIFLTLTLAWRPRWIPAHGNTCEIKALEERQTTDIVLLRYSSTTFSIQFTQSRHSVVRKSWLKPVLLPRCWRITTVLVIFNVL